MQMMQRASLQLLLISSHPSEIAAFQQFVKTCEFDCGDRIARTALEAQNLLATQHFDVVIADQLLAQEAGLFLLNFAEETTVIVITSSSTGSMEISHLQGIDRRLIRDPENQYLTELPALISTVIQQHQSASLVRSPELDLARIKATNLALLNTVPDLIFRVNRAGVYLDCRAAKHFDPVLPASEIVGKHVTEVLPSEVAALAQERIALALYQSNMKMFQIKPVGAHGCAPLPAQLHKKLVLQTNELQVFEYQLLKHCTHCIYEARIAPCGANEVLVLVRDISHLKQGEAILRRQSQLLKGVAEATNHLLIHTDYPVAIATALEVLGQVAEVSRVYLFENHVHPETGDLLTSQRFEWVAEPHLAQLHNPNLQNVCYQTMVPRWLEQLSAGQPIKGLVHHFPQNEQEILTAQSILSLMVIPIWVNGEFWGFIGLDDCVTERCWLAEEESALLVMARGIGGVVERQRAEQDANRNYRRSQLLTEMTLRIRRSLNLEEILNTTVIEVRQFLQADRVLILQFAPDWVSHVVVESVNPPWTSCLQETILDTCFQDNQGKPYLQGKVCTIRDVTRAGLTPCHRTLLERFQVRANLVVPIIEGQQLWGLLVAHQCSRPRQWHPFEVEFLSQLAEHVGLAIAQARLLNQAIQQRQQLETQNQALERARADAEAASQTKTAFLATVSHEIRTPMNAVLGMAGLLLDTELTPQQRDFVEMIRISGDTLMSLINDILDFSKLEVGEMALELLDFQLEASVEEIVDLLATKAYSKGLEISAWVDSNIPLTLRGDVGRLRQILMNLIDNAIKFTEQGEVVVCASLQQETRDRVELLFSVADTGIGIEDAARERLFQPFCQLDASTTRKYGGSGLGLAISRQLVEMMGGRIGLESYPGKGSTFWFTAQFKKPEAIARLAVPLTHWRGLRVLVVEDHPTSRDILRQHLTGWGMQVQETEDALTALRLLREGAIANTPFDLAIFDSGMIGMEDDSIAHQLQTDPLLESTQLVATTAMNRSGAIRQVLEQGFSAYLVKPIRRSRLLDVILECFPATEMGQAIAPEQLLTPTLRHTALSIQPDAQSLAEKLRILIVEDNVINQKVTLQQLGNLGFRADVAANGQEAIEAIARIPYNLVLMDCQMPVLDGYSATRYIRQQEQAEAVAQPLIIIAMTANAFPEDRERAIAAGMNDYLQKPVSKEALAATLAHWGNWLANQATPGSAVDDALIKSSLSVNQPDPTVAQQMNLQVNWKVLHDLSDHNPEFEMELLKLFIDDSHTHLKQLEEAIAAVDHTAIEHAAHHIKGASANIGATIMQAAADQLEQQARKQQLQAPQHLLNELQQSLNWITRFMKQEQ